MKAVAEQLKANKIYLEAQEYAIGYYAKEGFEVVLDPFMEDGYMPQLAANLSAEELLSVQWGYHRLIIDRCKELF